MATYCSTSEVGIGECSKSLLTCRVPKMTEYHNGLCELSIHCHITDIISCMLCMEYIRMCFAARCVGVSKAIAVYYMAYIAVQIHTVEFIEVTLHVYGEPSGKRVHLEIVNCPCKLLLHKWLSLW